MGGVIEQFLQSVVVDKITKQCQGIKNNLEADCNEIKGKINRLHAEVTSLKDQISGTKTVNKAVTTKKAVAKKAPAKKAVAKKASAKKTAKK